MSAENIGACPNFMGPGKWGQQGVCRPLLEAALKNPGDPKLSQVVCKISDQADYIKHALPNLTKGGDSLPNTPVVNSQALASQCPLVGGNVAFQREITQYNDANAWSTPLPYLQQEE